MIIWNLSQFSRLKKSRFNENSISACVSDNGDFSEVMDVEMEDVTSPLKVNDKYDYNYDDQTKAEKAGSIPTFSCTHSYIGLSQFIISSSLIVDHSNLGVQPPPSTALKRIIGK
eukprot:CAMPEP_0205816298 /NCGR_PEP_ID=MMETSP0205-20121125/22515_1 /ASSEMBLY_ACC=CAM_ASM_000278 /TAXON_ID=36767 /ORGANISM="Euplotes focardii, Strain TN1" /LENGTH=113 /DNA_ID=CAMNT_0053104363 /DNA_START=306 /DNA_END=645 /DNA_ORIENTATION=-